MRHLRIVSMLTLVGAFTTITSFAAVTKIVDFAGINASQAGLDPNTSVKKYMVGTSAVGPNHIFHIKAGSMQICSKTGVCDSPIQVEQRLFRDKPFMVSACHDNLDYTAQVGYDSLADRWVVVANSRDTSPPGVCFAVSETADPRGNYRRFFFITPQYSADARPSAARLGIWPDGYYVTLGAGSVHFLSNLFGFSVFPRTQMLTTLDVPEPLHFTVSEPFSIPGNFTGTTLPPSHVKNHLFETNAVANPTTGHADALGIYARKVVVDWNNRANSNVSTLMYLPFGAENQTGTACDTLGDVGCIPQPNHYSLGTGIYLTGLNQPINYRNTGSNGSGSFLMARSYDKNGGHWPWHFETIAWSEVRLSSDAAPFFQQQGKLWGGDPESLDSHSRFAANLAMNKNGDIAIGYSHSGETVNPGVRIAGRLSGAAAGAVPEGELTVFTGPSVINDERPASHWGPSTMTVDPDGCTFWYFGNYVLSGDWATRVTSATLPKCNMAKGRPVTTSSNESSSLNGPKAVDGNTTTRWASAQGSDPQWICVDLGSQTHIKKVVLRWEAAYAKAFKIQTSTAGTSCSRGASWTDSYSTTTGPGGNQTITLSTPAPARFVRMYGTQRATAFGYSLFEFEVYGQ